MIEHAIQDILANDSSVVAFVTDRIFYLKAQQDVESPYLVVSKISSPRYYSHGGESGLAHSRIQIDVYADTYRGVKQIADAVQTALSAYVGTSQSVQIESCFLDNEIDIYESGEDLYHTALDFIIIHSE